ncbi:sugar transferase [Cognatishimia activa]|uniref:sugar transferase n=1 Tax=Cognatishimia activa TaxID=1715691 RepID=UPI002231B7AB|nr:sugar transferase [Cognatishimia activa]UZD90612.1 sugar transferase [Cognatishimia activa]
MKRLIDLIISLTLLPLLLLVLAAACVANRIEGAGPVLFRQTRYGSKGQPFSIYKVRTMRVAEAGNQFNQARRGDARVTGFGRLLRASSLDELPQLLNVLRGDMSLVGPRPHPTQLDETYRRAIEDYDRRFDVKPGITGLAQVRGHRGPTETIDVMRARIACDIEYVERSSVLLDIQILFRTFAAVLVPKNAY